MIKIIDLTKVDNVLFGTTSDGRTETFKKGDKFKMDGTKFKVLSQGNCTEIIPLYRKILFYMAYLKFWK